MLYLHNTVGSLDVYTVRTILRYGFVQLGVIFRYGFGRLKCSGVRHFSGHKTSAFYRKQTFADFSDVLVTDATDGGGASRRGGCVQERVGVILAVQRIRYRPAQRAPFVSHAADGLRDENNWLGGVAMANQGRGYG